MRVRIQSELFPCWFSCTNVEVTCARCLACLLVTLLPHPHIHISTMPRARTFQLAKKTTSSKVCIFTGSRVPGESKLVLTLAQAREYNSLSKEGKKKVLREKAQERRQKAARRKNNALKRAAEACTTPDASIVKKEQQLSPSPLKAEEIPTPGVGIQAPQ